MPGPFSLLSVTGQTPSETPMMTAMSQQIYPDAMERQVPQNNYAVVLDPDIQRDNPVEAKHRRLVRSHRNGPLDRDLKPNPKIRDELNVRPWKQLQKKNTVYSLFFNYQKSIMSYPPTQMLTPEEKDLVWKFRFYLTREKRVNLCLIKLSKLSSQFSLFPLGFDQVLEMCCLD